jgi:hypothetical protein
MPQIYLSPRSGFNIRMCNPELPCPPSVSYNPANLEWVFDQYEIEDDLSLNEIDATAWDDDAGAFNEASPPDPPPVVYRGDDAFFRSSGQGRQWFYDKQIEEFEKTVQRVVRAKRKRKERIPEIVEAFEALQAEPSLAPVSVDLASINRAIERLEDARIGYNEFLASVQAHLRQIEEQQARRRRQNDDAIALLLLM